MENELKFGQLVHADDDDAGELAFGQFPGPASDSGLVFGQGVRDEEDGLVFGQYAQTDDAGLEFGQHAPTGGGLEFGHSIDPVEEGGSPFKDAIDRATDNLMETNPLKWPIQAVGEIGRNIATTFDDPNDLSDWRKQLFEFSTGEKMLDQGEMRKLDTRQQMRQQRMQQNIAENVGTDIVQLGKGIGTLAAEGLKLPFRAAQQDDPIGFLWDGTVSVGGMIVGGIIEDLSKLARDPAQFAGTEPMAALSTASMVAGPVAGATKGLQAVQAGGKFLPAYRKASYLTRESMRPTKVAGKLVEKFAETGPNAQAIAQTLWSAKAGIDSQVQQLSDVAKRSLNQARFKLQQDLADLGKMKKTDRALVSQALRGEAKDASEAMVDYVKQHLKSIDNPDAPGNMYDLVRRELGRSLMPEDIDAAMLDSARMTVLEAVKAGKRELRMEDVVLKSEDSVKAFLEASGVKGAQEAYGALKEYKPKWVDFIDEDTGSSIYDPMYMLTRSTRDINPQRIKAVALEGAPTFVADPKNLRVIEDTKRVLMTSGINMGEIIVKGKPLVPDDILLSHMASYLPSKWRSYSDPAVLAVLEGSMPDVQGLMPHLGTAAEGLMKARFKELPFAVQEQMGRMGDGDIARVMALSVPKTVATTARAKLFDIIDDPMRYVGKGLDEDVANLIKQKYPSYSMAEWKKLPIAEKKLYRLVDDKTVSGVRELPRWGSLSGKYVKKDMYRLLKQANQTSSTLNKWVDRWMAIFKANVVVNNIPSWLHATFGNTIVDALDGGNPFGLWGGSAKLLDTKTELGRKFHDAMVETDALSGNARMVGDVSDIYEGFARAGRDWPKFIMKEFKDTVKTHNMLEGAAEATKAVGRATTDLAEGLTYKIFGFNGRATDIFVGIDNIARASAYKRALLRWQKMYGGPKDLMKLLDIQDAREFAGKHANRLYLDYSDIPYAADLMRMSTMAPFIAYPWKAMGMFNDFAATNPVRYQALADYGRENYTEMSKKERKGFDMTPGYKRGYAHNINVIPDALGLKRKGDWEINTRWLNPAPRPYEVLGFDLSGGGVDSDLFGDEQLVGQLSGPPQAIASALAGQDFYTHEKLEGIDRITKPVGSFMVPTYIRKGLEKIPAGYRGELDYRGREQDPYTSVLHTLGIRVEPRRSKEHTMRVEAQYHRERAKAKKEFADKSKNAGLEKRAELRMELSRELHRLREKYNRLRGVQY